MFVLKTFVTHSQFVDNGVKETAPFGELSTDAATYSRDIGQYVDQAYPKLTLHSFFCKEDGAVAPVTPVVAKHVLGIIDYVYTYTLTNSGEVFSDILLAELLETFAATGEAFTCGEMVTDGTYFVPEWLSWKAKGVAGLGTNEIRVWLADTSFKLQYDEFEIVVVPPTTVVDNFFKTGTEVGLMLNAQNASTMVAKMQDARDEYPYTRARVMTYDYIDPYLSTHKVPSDWGILIYGDAGNNVDSISDVLIDYILSRSAHTRAEWTEILPDLFRRTEFLLLPSWFQYAISPRKTQPGGVPSPVLTINQISTRIKEAAPAYTDAHINQNAQVVPHPYASLSIIAMGSPDNKEGKFKLTDFYPDYIAVPTSSTDFNRMGAPTKAWLDVLQDQLVAAETMTEFSSVPHSMTRTKRNGMVYLVTNVNNVNYLMAVRSNYADEFVPLD
jgi:hypothetical protein